jgi:hypothetical protein
MRNLRVHVQLGIECDVMFHYKDGDELMLTLRHHQDLLHGNENMCNCTGQDKGSRFHHNHIYGMIYRSYNDSGNLLSTSMNIMTTSRRLPNYSFGFLCI